jgi:hypothetical protein
MKVLFIALGSFTVAFVVALILVAVSLSRQEGDW